MADVFISYKREERSRIQPLARALESHGFSVWWDFDLVPGDKWKLLTKTELEKARCVIVAWTNQSVGDNKLYTTDWIDREARTANARGVLIPVLLDKGRIAWDHENLQYANLVGWKGEADHPGFARFLQGVTRLVRGEGASPPPAPPPRPPEAPKRSNLFLIAAGGVAVAALVAWLFVFRGAAVSPATEQGPAPPAATVETASGQQPDAVGAVEPAFAQLSSHEWLVLRPNEIAQRVLTYATFDAMRAAAEAGDARAQAVVGAAYWDNVNAVAGSGDGNAAAIPWLRRAVEQGQPVAQFELGYAYFMGVSAPRDHAEAVRLYRLAADQGYAPAQWQLGVRYLNGEGVAADRAECVRLTRLAARQGFSPAQSLLQQLGETW